MKLEDLKGLGPKRLKALGAEGIYTLWDLARFLPLRYEDHTRPTPIGELKAGEEALVEAQLRGQPSQTRVNGKVLTRAVLYDDTGRIGAIWFGQVWMFKHLTQAGRLLLYGRVGAYNGKLTLNTPRIVSGYEIQPVYRAIDAIPPKSLRELIKSALEQLEIEETLPEALLKEYGLMGRRDALWQAHFPLDRDSLQSALYRLSFEDALYFMLSTLSHARVRRSGQGLKFERDDVNAYLRSLPFPLTGAQARVLDEIAQDLKQDTPMARLVQGDVGSGKTAVAFGAIYLCARAGRQAAMMAPTEILAQQHYESARQLLEPLGVRCGLLTGSMSAKQHREAKAMLAGGQWDAVFGTHALITPDVTYQNLGLAITDEQHRFGVKQRVLLGEKGASPHVLVMSATPIPRTLALILYGDLDLSVIDELPPGRKPVLTRIVPEEKRQDMYGFILKEIRQGRQAYFVCPLVEDSELTEAESAQTLFKTLQQSALGCAPIALVHGRQRPEEKEAALEAFKRGEVKILVSTTVIEVGINVPSATIMVVENAERFGLAQLHQLRGRVGRGSDQAWCFLMTEAAQKLKVLVNTNDGFVIAEKDMEQRGPGDIFGTRQSGALGGLDVSALRDVNLLKLTNELAKRIAKSEGEEAQHIRENAEDWLSRKSELVLAAN